MLVFQPPFLLRYFSRNVNPVSDSTARLFMLSWEDALWHLLDVYKIPDQTTVLVPEFFCGNVIDHMHEHGLEVIYYPVDNRLQTPTPLFVELLQKHKPGIVIIFHSVGITNQLLKQADFWIDATPENALLIEDCVHRVVDPSRLTFLTDRHVVIDSLRKVMPIQGSWVYSLKPLSRVTVLKSLMTLPYRLVVGFWWMVMQSCLLLAYFSKFETPRYYLNLWAERAMLIGYEIIGTHRYPSPGLIGMQWMWARARINTIKNSKIWQYEAYHALLHSWFEKNPAFSTPYVNADDKENLRGYPLIVDLSVADTFLKVCRQNGILLRFELNDGKWSENQKIVYLPMGLHLLESDLEQVVSVIVNFVSQHS